MPSIDNSEEGAAWRGLQEVLGSRGALTASRGLLLMKSLFTNLHAKKKKICPELKFHHFLIIVLDYERAAAGNLGIFDCIFHPNDFIEETTARDERLIVEVETSSVSSYN